MNLPLITNEEARVLGCLIEKERTTPEYYPLTLNALQNACNQKTNREPVVQYDEQTVEIALDGLNRKGLVSNVSGAGLRAKKFLHLTETKLAVGPAETAVLCVLLLRGPQTPGEIRGRTGRMHEFAELSDLEILLDQMTKSDNPLVMQLPKLPGTKEFRYVQLLTGEPDVSQLDQASTYSTTSASSALDELRAEVHQLRTDLDDLRNKFEALLEQLS
jgi:uncharacterized protein YceH (UPF0502 family)